MPMRDLAQDEQINRLLTVANIQLRRGQAAEAEKAVLEILQSRPDDPAAHEMLADIRLTRGDFAGAEEALQKALALEPGRPTAEAKLARAALRRTEQERIAQIGVAYAASDTALMRFSGGGSRRNSQWAAFGSALVPGLGQYVNGETAKGIIIAAVYFLIIIIMAVMPDTSGLFHQISLFFVPNLRADRAAAAPVSGFTWFLLILLTADWLYAIIDAAAASRRASESSPKNDGWEV
jgi:tetratricopeptide (TPR) repeat protein